MKLGENLDIAALIVHRRQLSKVNYSVLN